MEFFLLQTLNGLTFSAVLFLITIGFSIIFGLMRIINLSHATLYTLGGSIGITVVQYTGSFILAIICGGLSMAVLGMAMERFLLNRLHGKELEQVLLTLGLMFIIEDIILIGWGGYPLRTPAPALFSGSSSFVGITFPTYRLMVIVLGVVAAIAMWFLLERTKFGAIIRAGADREEMTQAIGININRIFLLTFGLGALLVGVAGVIAAPLIAIQTGTSMEYLTLAIVVMTVGGMGSLPGVIVGSLFVGIVDSFGRALFPSLAYFTLFVPMVLVLIIRPQGLLGRSDSQF